MFHVCNSYFAIYFKNSKLLLCYLLYELGFIPTVECYRIEYFITEVIVKVFVNCFV